MCFFFFFNDTATTEIYTLSLHDALPISIDCTQLVVEAWFYPSLGLARAGLLTDGDRKSTRLNSSHSQISYAVFCLKKKKKNDKQTTTLIITNVYRDAAMRQRRVDIHRSL